MYQEERMGKRMATKNNNGKRVGLDPGNTLLVLYVGLVMCILLLGMVVGADAAGSRSGNRGEFSFTPQLSTCLLGDLARSPGGPWQGVAVGRTNAPKAL